LPAVRAPLAEVGPIKSPLESDSAPVNNSPKKQKGMKNQEIVPGPGFR